ncbi:heme/hemin ABC transporter substrate-binding protein [Leminorella grimontii]|uniref:heme/hemin ABC transporter substrate-binding protein n=1 Tax=Leminorella grimontii TaxID=82981 RepID=UPI0032204CF7
MIRLLTLVAALSAPLWLQAQERVVIAGGSLTEVVYALGAGDEVIAVDQTTSYPPQTQSLPQIGYWKQLSSEGILALKPTLFLTWSDAEPGYVLSQLPKLGVKVVALPRTPATVSQLSDNIRQVATVLNRQAAGDALIADIEKTLITVKENVDRHAKKTNVLFLLNIDNAEPQVAGRQSIADGIMAMAGGVNVATHVQYKKYSGEGIISSNPDVIVVTQQSLSVAGGMAKLGEIPGVQQTPAWKNQRIVAIDRAIILGMGPRVGLAVEQLYQGFYPANGDN